MNRPETSRDRHELDSEARYWRIVNGCREMEQRKACPTAAALRDQVDELLPTFGLEEWDRVLLLNRTWIALSDALDDFLDVGPALETDIRQVITFAREEP